MAFGGWEINLHRMHGSVCSFHFCSVHLITCAKLDSVQFRPVRHDPFPFRQRKIDDTEMIAAYQSGHLMLDKHMQFEGPIFFLSSLIPRAQALQMSICQPWEYWKLFGCRYFPLVSNTQFCSGSAALFLLAWKKLTEMCRCSWNAWLFDYCQSTICYKFAPRTHKVFTLVKTRAVHYMNADAFLLSTQSESAFSSKQSSFPELLSLLSTKLKEKIPIRMAIYTKPKAPTTSDIQFGYRRFHFVFVLACIALHLSTEKSNRYIIQRNKLFSTVPCGLSDVQTQAHCAELFIIHQLCADIPLSTWFPFSFICFPFLLLLIQLVAYYVTRIRLEPFLSSSFHLHIIVVSH